MASGLHQELLSGGARELFGGHFRSKDDRQAAVRRALRPLLPEVAAALEAQNAPYLPSAARDAHLAALRNGAAAVVTGQQAGLFLGPLYTLYKAAHAILLARRLSEETSSPVVPVFWLQTEDHDLPEIASIAVPRAAGEPLVLSVPAEAEDRRSIAHRTLPEEVRGAIEALEAELANLPHAEAHLSQLGRHYRAGAPWGRAFAGMIAELFAPEGLVLIDPRDAPLARLAAPIHRRSILEAAPISEALLDRARMLDGAGWGAPVHVREGAPLSFFHPRGPSGPRYRLAPDGAGNFVEVGGTGVHSREALLAALEAEPLSFSTSALLRPILQDRLLPAAAYVGGPGEVAYFAQLAPLYAAFELELPLVVPRAQLRIVEEKIQRLLSKHHLTPDDAARGETELLARVRSTSNDSDAAAALERELFETFDATLRRLLPEPDAALETALEKTRGTVKMAISKLGEKYARASLHRDRALVDELARIRAALVPGGVPQERVLGLSYFAARYGTRPFLERVMAAIDPLQPQLRDLHP